MVSAKRDLPDMGKVIDHGLNPKSPAGRFHALVPVTHGVFAYGPDPQAAKDFLRWIMDPKQFRPWISSGDMYFAPYLHAFDKFPDWDIEPRVKPYQKVLETGKLTSWPAPANRAHAAVITRWVVIDMFSKGWTVAPNKPVMAEHVAQLKQNDRIAGAESPKRAVRGRSPRAAIGRSGSESSSSGSPSSAGSCSRRPCCSCSRSWAIRSSTG